MPRRKDPDSKRRSPSGMGSVSLRADNRYWARITLEDGSRKAYYGHTEGEVKDKLIKALADKQKGTLIAGRVPSLSDFASRYLTEVAKPKLKASTLLRYRQLLEKHTLPTLGKVKLSKLGPQHLQRLYNTKLAEGMAPRTVGHLHRCLHVALETALRWGYVSRNVCDLVDPPRVAKTEQQVFSIAQARRFLEVIQGDPLEAYYILALTTGLRAGELRALKWEAVDFEQQTVSVHRSVRRVYKMGWVESEPKTKSGWRMVPLIQPAIAALKSHRTKQLELRLQTGPLWQDSGRIFTNSVGKPLEDSNIARRSLRPLLEKAGLPQIRFHDLRHSAATTLLALGVEMRVISALLGHSGIAITADLYTHVLSETTKEAVNRLNTLFQTPQ